MRGKAIPFYLFRPPAGITPAYAGKSSIPEGRKIRDWDHPRVCGEKIVGRYIEMFCKGSPPRMRGKDSESLEIQALLFSSAHFSFNF